MSAAPLTISRDPRVERALALQLGRITERLQGLLPRDRRCALLLSGSFGRGEGVARIADARLEIQNDYDLELILDGSPLRFFPRYRRLRATVDAAMAALAAELCVKQIDVGIKNLSLLRDGPRTIALYELGKGHRFLAGDGSLVRELPAISPEEIDLAEGARLLLNRGGGLLMAAAYCLRRGPLSAAERHNLELEMAKAVLACGDLRLLARGRYRGSQLARATQLRHERLLAEPPALRSLYARALRYKLHWEPWLDGSRIWDEWDRVRALYLDCWKDFESQRLGRRIRGWEDYLRMRKPRHETRVRDLARLLARGLPRRGERRLFLERIRRGPEVFLLSALPLLLEAVGPQGMSRDGLAAISRALAVGEPSTLPWRRAVELFLRLWHPEGEAGRVADALGGPTQTSALA